MPSADKEEDGAENQTAGKTTMLVALSEFAMNIFKALTFKPPKPKSPPSPTLPPLEEVPPKSTTLPPLEEVPPKSTPSEPVVVEEEPRPSRTIEIVKGDTLWGLSREHGVSIDSIKEANGITGDTIYAGRKLIIP